MKAKIGKHWGKLFNEGHWLARKPVKRRPTSLVVRKTHVNGVDVTVGRESPGHTDQNSQHRDNQPSVAEEVGRQQLSYTDGGNVKSTATWENILANGTADIIMKSIIYLKEASGKRLCCIIPILRLSGKGETMEAAKRCVVARG